MCRSELAGEWVIPEKLREQARSYSPLAPRDEARKLGSGQANAGGAMGDFQLTDLLQPRPHDVAADAQQAYMTASRRRGRPTRATINDAATAPRPPAAKTMPRSRALP